MLRSLDHKKHRLHNYRQKKRLPEFYFSIKEKKNLYMLDLF